LLWTLGRPLSAAVVGIVIAAAIVSFDALTLQSFQEFESKSESEFERALVARRNKASETASICDSDCEQYDLRTSLAEATFGHLCSQLRLESSINETRARVRTIVGCG
jgi:hypothetical protein